MPDEAEDQADETDAAADQDDQSQGVIRRGGRLPVRSTPGRHRAGVFGGGQHCGSLLGKYGMVSAGEGRKYNCSDLDEAKRRWRCEGIRTQMRIMLG